MKNLDETIKEHFKRGFEGKHLGQLGIRSFNLLTCAVLSLLASHLVELAIFRLKPPLAPNW